MHQKLKNFIRKHNLLNKDDIVAIAVSGGKDSVCAAHLFNSLKSPFVMVHCNFNLRGEESNSDEKFVTDLSVELKYCEAVYTKSFDTKSHIQEVKSNVQLAARELRYAYFYSLRQQGIFTKLVVAHHQDDSLESFFINLYRGSGIVGLKGIPTSRDYIIRPMQAFSKSEIDNYFEENDLLFREDSSNSSNKYLRNSFRNEVIPFIDNNIKDFSERSKKSLRIIQEESSLLSFFIKRELNTEDCTTEIQKDWLTQFPAPHILLYNAVKDFGFNYTQCTQLLDAKTGSLFHSASHEILVDRLSFIISEATDSVKEELQILGAGKFSLISKTISIEKADKPIFDDNKSVEYVSLSQDQFPITLRNWKNGDWIQPLGMTGRKLLSDFFIDEKIDSFNKKSILLLAKDKEILWIVGYRISESLKVVEDSDIYKMTYHIK